MPPQHISSERRLKSLCTEHEEPTHMGRGRADPGGLAKANINHEISLPQFVRSPPAACLEVSHEFKGLLKLFSSSVPKPFW